MLCLIYYVLITMLGCKFNTNAKWIHHVWVLYNSITLGQQMNYIIVNGHLLIISTTINFVFFIDLIDKDNNFIWIIIKI